MGDPVRRIFLIWDTQIDDVEWAIQTLRDGLATRDVELSLLGQDDRSGTPARLINISAVLPQSMPPDGSPRRRPICHESSIAASPIAFTGTTRCKRRVEIGSKEVTNRKSSNQG